MSFNAREQLGNTDMVHGREARKAIAGFDGCRSNQQNKSRGREIWNMLWSWVRKALIHYNMV